MRLSGRFTPEFVQLAKYAGASAAALALDYGLLIALTEGLGLHYLLAAAIAFVCGAALAYALSVTFVFDSRRVADRRIEFTVFALVGVAGLAVSQLIMLLGVEIAGVHYAAAKLLAVGASFLLNYALRRALLFAPRAAAA